MNLGASGGKGIVRSYATSNENTQLSEINKKLRILTDNLNKGLCCVKDAILDQTSYIDSTNSHTNLSLSGLISLNNRILDSVSQILANTSSSNSLQTAFKTVSNDISGTDPAIVSSGYIPDNDFLNIRSITLTLWGVDALNTVTINTSNSQKLFNKLRYNGYTFTYSIDKLSDIKVLFNSIEVTGTAEVDLVITHN